MGSRPVQDPAPKERTTSQRVEVHPLTSSTDASWSDFVERSDRTTFFHELSWKKVLESSFPFQARYFLVRRGGAVTGVLPLFSVDNPFVRPTLVSVPFGVYGGVVAEDAESEGELVERVATLSREEGVSYCELRQVESVDDERLVPKNGYATFIRDLPEDPAECLRMLPRKARAAARQAIHRHSLEISAGPEQVDEFYRLFVHNKRHLGSPVLPRRFFDALFEVLGDRADLMLVRYRGRAVSGVVSFLFKDRVMPYYSGSLHEHEGLQINNFMYLKLMERGVDLGCRSFDFGRSRADSGSYRFKKHQGFQAQALGYQYYLERSKELPDLSPSNPRFRLAEEIWKRLPLPVVRGLGPLLIRYFV